MNTNDMQARAEQARELASKATAGEWRVWSKSGGTLAIYSPKSTNLPAMDIAEVYDDDSPSGNAAFIAASRSLMPQLADDVLALIAERERLLYRAEQLRSAIDDICQSHTHTGACAIAFAATLADEDIRL